MELYHYTTFQALDGILNNKEIWLGNLRYMNDRSELTHLSDLIEQALIEELPDYTDKIKDLFLTQKRKFDNKTAYAFSLSTSVDDASQWDRYANGGRGVCIKFNENKLRKCLEGIASLQEVFYGRDAHEHQAKELLKKYFLNNNLSGQFGTVDELFENVWYAAIAHKHSSFSSESEIRICAWPFLKSVSIETLKYITSDTGLREYYPIKLGSGINDIDNYIEQIWLGPKSGVDENLFFRYLQKKQRGAEKISIVKSQCPLR